ncbi:alpha-tubulin N-acetyltransferase 1-like [Paramacrobiotus metropolitanus]|uniref:alpha-tubulin N-acetyltransferase 1-like n=1 Tax=Paramacrobiotus metropolitanus TaxID=2943436 RepID=UPI002445A02D|nr:alpha-tubulin N-acetyltransferase 1-like [Paramacrobiotus metropolitanus]
MDCGFNINHVLPDEMTIVDADADFWKNTSVGGGREFLRQEITTIIDRIGEASAQNQGLLSPITSSAKLRASSHRLYIMKDANAHQYRGGVIGYVKVARKQLVIFDSKGQRKQYEPVCVLDFFVDPGYQRQGYGTKIFKYMMQREHVASAADLAIDRPGAKCLSFLARKYGLTDTVKQPSHFVVFKEFFTNNAGTDLETVLQNGHSMQNGHQNGTAQNGYKNGMSSAADAAGPNGMEPTSNGWQTVSNTNGYQNGNGMQYDNGEMGKDRAAGMASYPLANGKRDDIGLAGALRPTKGPNLHYVHSQLW